MEPLVFGVWICLLLQISKQAHTNKSSQEIRRANRKMVKDFIEDQLIEHGQALEQILKMVQRNEDLTKRLIDNMSMRLSPPEPPEKIEEPLHASRRNLEEVTVHPVEQFGNMIPRFGGLVKDWLITQLRHQDKDPLVLVE